MTCFKSENQVRDHRYYGKYVQAPKETEKERRGDVLGPVLCGSWAGPSQSCVNVHCSFGQRITRSMGFFWVGEAF